MHRRRTQIPDSSPGSFDDVGDSRICDKVVKACYKIALWPGRLQRAKLWWTEGLLHYRFGDFKAAWWALDVARRSLVALKAAPEIAAVTADMAQISPQPLAVRHLCYEAAEVITAPHILAEHLRTLESATQEEIPAAAAALREAAVRLAPCPAL